MRRWWIQLYGGEAGATYEYSHITVEGNLWYDNGGGYHMYAPGLGDTSHITGPLVVRHNTAISGNEDANWTEPRKRFWVDGYKQTFTGYDSPGGIFENNLFITSVSLPSDAAHNVVYHSWTDPLPPSNMEVASSRENDYIDTSIFVSPDYSHRFHGRTASAGGALDFTPQSDAEVCTMSGSGGYVGAIACSSPEPPEGQCPLPGYGG